MQQLPALDRFIQRQLASMCDGKAQYRTLEFAEQVARRRESEGAPKLTVYMCTNCQYFHLAKDKRAPIRYPWLRFYGEGGHEGD